MPDWTPYTHAQDVKFLGTDIVNPSLAPPPPTYLRRNTKVKDSNGNCNWESCEWGYLMAKSWLQAANLIDEWNKKGTASLISSWEFKLPLHCERCYTCVHETYPAIGLEAGLLGKHVCYSCHLAKGKEQQNDMQCTKCGTYTTKSYGKPALCLTCFKVKNESVIAKAKAMGVNIVRKIGDTWALSKANAPFQAEQWGYRGTGKLPYVITHYLVKVDGATTSDGWACSCMSFTRNVPRTPCKHILQIMLNTGKTPTGMSAKAATIGAAMTDDVAKDFQKWQLEQAAKKALKPAAGVAAIDLFGATGRRFR